MYCCTIQTVALYFLWIGTPEENFYILLVFISHLKLTYNVIGTNAGIGAQTALKLIRQHGSLEVILENLNKDRYHIPDPWPYQEARRLFKEPIVTPSTDIPELKWINPDEEGLNKFLVEENGFNHDRVMKGIEKIKAAKNKSAQGRLESFFKPSLALDSAAPKRKEAPDAKLGKDKVQAKKTKGMGNPSNKKGKK
ncbi:hypothetical protein O6H91_Y540900 [Diphasiastrum complanatum]|nr:hypothetical protein O6H91_Y540900 [Diphasiastrum complanatum]